MSLVELTEMIVKSLVKEEDSVSVKEFETEDNEITIEIVVSDEKVIGVCLNIILGHAGIIRIKNFSPGTGSRNSHRRNILSLRINR